MNEHLRQCYVRLLQNNDSVRDSALHYIGWLCDQIIDNNYRRLCISDPVVYGTIVRAQGGERCLLALGFVKVRFLLYVNYSILCHLFLSIPNNSDKKA